MWCLPESRAASRNRLRRRQRPRGRVEAETELVGAPLPAARVNAERRLRRSLTSRQRRPYGNCEGSGWDRSAQRGKLASASLLALAAPSRVGDHRESGVRELMLWGCQCRASIRSRRVGHRDRLARRPNTDDELLTACSRGLGSQLHRFDSRYERATVLFIECSERWHHRHP